MKVTQKYWAVADKDVYGDSPFVLRLLNWNPRGVAGYILVRDEPYEFTVDVPDEFDIRAGLVANLESEKLAVMAAYQKRVTEINAQIQQLLAIEA